MTTVGEINVPVQATPPRGVATSTNAIGAAKSSLT
jgi:hypothetical protein